MAIVSHNGLDAHHVVLVEHVRLQVIDWPEPTAM